MKYKHRYKEELFGLERRIDEIVRIPESWSELREALRNLTPARNYGIELIYYGRCRNCGGRFNATSPRKNYCSEKCAEKAAVARWYLPRLQRGDFKDAMIRKRQKEHRIVEARTAEQERVREQQERLQSEELFRGIVYGNFDKKILHQYNDILRCLGGGDEVKGYKKIRDWYDKRLKFEQIPAEDQRIFINCMKNWGN